MGTFLIDWFPGASAQLEFLRASNGYQLRYVSPFRPTIRIPSPGSPLTDQDLRDISGQLDQIVVGVDARAGGTGGAGTATPQDELSMAGQNLFTLAVPADVEADLRPQSLFLDVGVDQQLVKYPWELMHDGEEFLCRKHYTGRFVNVAEARVAPPLHATTWLGAPIDSLRVLLISVPAPLPRRDGTLYKPLQAVLRESTSLVQTVAGIPGVTVATLKDEQASIAKVAQELSSGKYHIIHYTGHSTTSGLVLYDRDMSATALEKYVAKGHPILCFINGCDSGNTQDWTSRYDIFDMARAFLETGSYLLGSRWPLADVGAAVFAQRFYVALLKEAEPIGKAVQLARLEAKQKSPADLAWASYVFYGDPRVHFKVHEAARSQ